MKVLIVHDYGTLTGGAEQVSAALRDGLRRRGHDARFFSSTARPLDMSLVSDYTCFGTESPLRRVLQAVNPFAARRLSQVLHEFRPEVVHVRMFLWQLSPLILPLLRRVPSLLHVVNYDLICPLNTKLLPDGSACHFRQGAACKGSGCMGITGMMRYSVQRRLLWRNFDVFRLVVTNSHWVRKRLMDDGVRVDEVVWNGVPVSAQRPPLLPEPLVAYTGRLVAKKGVNVLLDAMRHVLRRVPKARLSIIGDGPERERLQQQVDAMGLGARVTFAGHLPRPELERRVAAAWVQVVPSLWEEPFGLVAAEAMMRGTAVVASASGGLTEQVVDGQTGFCVPPRDSAALADALIRLLVDRERAEAMGAAARAHALANFTEDRVVDRFAALYDRIVREEQALPR